MTLVSRTMADGEGAGLAPGEVNEHRHVLHLPSPRAFVRHALPSLIESTIGPAVLFYIVLVTAGFRGALIAALAWSYLAAGRRLVRRQRIPGMLLIGLLLVSLRTVAAFITGSAFVYFIQPTAATFGVGVVFLVTAVARRPLVERLAHDFCPFDPDLTKNEVLRRFFLRVSFLWALVLSVNAGFVLFLLLRSSLQAFVIERTVASSVLTVGGVVLSVLWFVRVMGRHGIAVRFNSALQLAHLPVESGRPLVAAEELSA
ncbi:MAG TPA: VC0807 family protein [Acidimicrobiales bacterium]|nr:VC0807 family protein [Acidimicrobiales bacterium]